MHTSPHLSLVSGIGADFDWKVVVALTKKNSNAAEILTFLHKFVAVRPLRTSILHSNERALIEMNCEYRF